ncbi:MAG: hypothetical protein OXH99_17900 [Bryobacterales bacterium]|nr:hypothetical protein [Bryobacterales bacterium]
MAAAVARCAGPLALLPGLFAQHGWIAESPHFRVLVQEAPGLDAESAATAADDLESIRRAFEQAGLGSPRREDGRLEVLIVPHRLQLHALLGDPPSSRTRGITIRGLDRDCVVVPWHAPLGTRAILAHEYAHQLDGRNWPPWFSEGRAVYLARRTAPRADIDPLSGLFAMLDRSSWIAWEDLLSADRHSPTAHEELFQAQSWLLVHWLASGQPDLSRLSPAYSAEVLASLEGTSLNAALVQHLAEARNGLRDWLVPPAVTAPAVQGRAAEEWRIPLFEAEARLSLRMLAAAEATLSDLAARFPAQARVRAAEAALQLMRGRQEQAERGYGAAIRLGDSRARTAYRYAVLLLGPGEAPRIRAEEALPLALRARHLMPGTPDHHLAVVHARMLSEDWKGAFADLRPLLAFPGWAGRADQEAREIRRRIGQAIRSVPAPELAGHPAPEPGAAPVPEPAAMGAWVEPEEGRQPAAGYRWPPYGSWLAHGRIAWVECDGDRKTVILHSPYQRLALRENPDRPPKLINRPFKWKTLPCSSRGWSVAVAYRKSRGPGGTHGEIVGIRF